MNMSEQEFQIKIKIDSDLNNHLGNKFEHHL